MAKPLGHDDADLIIEDIGHGRATSPHSVLCNMLIT